MGRLKSKRCSVIGITGTPGTGKKSVGQAVAETLGHRFLELNRIAFESGAIVEGGEDDFEVDPDRLRRHVLQRLGDGGVVLVGHLLPHVLRRGEVDFVAVLRCAPSNLEARYAGRGYSDAKIRENVASEILDVCLTEALDRFGADVLAEFDTTGRRPRDVAKEVVAVFRGLAKRSLGRVDWLSGRSAEGLIERYLR